MQTNARKKGQGRGRGQTNPRVTTRRRSMQKTKYVFLSSIKRTALYRDYFTPSPEVEKKVLGLSDLVIDLQLTLLLLTT